MSRAPQRVRTFDAFISYSRRDEAFAARLEKSLERYRIPREFRRGRSRFEVFRDVEDASIGELGEVLRQALESSEYLIVVCSPDSRGSGYVDQEIEIFASKRDASRIIPVLASGRPNAEVARDGGVEDSAFPEALCELLDEPLAADFRRFEGESRGKRGTRLLEARFQVIAKLLGTRKTEELVGRERRRRLLRLGGLAAALALVLAGASWYLWDRIPKPGIVTSELALGDESPRVEERLAALRSALAAEIPDRRDPDHLLVATWALRDFGDASPAQRAVSLESTAYLAEILSYFDIVALQEMAGDAAEFETALQRLRNLLGRHWQAVISGVTEGRAGDRERLGFLYDARKLRFGQFTDEIVLPPEVLERLGLEAQIARTPFMAGFHFGDQKLLLCTAHIWFGSGRAGLERRRNEVEALASYLATTHDSGRLWADTLILLGDLQVTGESDPSLEALRERGFILPAGLERLATDYGGRRPYDQLAIRWPESGPTLRVVRGGVFNPFDHVYRDQDRELYADDYRRPEVSPAPEQVEERRYRQWKTYKISDHLPKWLLLEALWAE